MSFPTTSLNIEISNSQFYFNSAPRSGGGIQWYNNHPFISNCDFNSNQALYGNDIASFPVQVNSSLYNDSNKNLVPPGQTITPPFLIYAQDDLNQTVLIDFISTAKISMVGNEASLFGSTNLNAKNGLFALDNLQIFGPQNTSIVLNISFDFTSLGGTGLVKPFTVKLRPCVSGEEFLNNNTCSVCKINTYSLIPGEPCQACPIGAICNGGNNLTVLDGYWRNSTTSDIIFPCPVIGACPQQNISSQITCATGYTSILCQPCDFGFAKINADLCSQCGSDSQSIGMLIGYILLILANIVMLTYSNISDADKEDSISSCYFKMITNFFQVNTIAIALNLNWPVTFTNFFSFFGNISVGSTQLINCILSKQSNYYFKKALIINFGPFVSILLTVLIFFLIKVTKKNMSHFNEKLLGSIIVQLYFFQSSVIQNDFSLLNCTELYPGEFYLTDLMSIKCWESDHYNYALKLAVPSLLVWSIVFPFALLLFLFKKRSILKEIKAVLILGFLYKDYSEKRFYWEFFSMAKKILLLSFIVFLKTQGKSIQALFSLLVLIAAFVIQIRLRPYKADELNQMDLNSTTVTIASLYTGLFFLSNSIGQSFQFFLLLVVIFAYCNFFCHWGFYIIRFYLTKIIVRYPVTRKIIGKKFSAKILDIAGFLFKDQIEKNEIVSSESKTEIKIVQTQTTKPEKFNQNENNFGGDLGILKKFFGRKKSELMIVDLDSTLSQHRVHNSFSHEKVEEEFKI